MPDEAPRPHHPFSPSKLQFLEACPCYESRETQHERAIAGTLAHKVTETRQDDNRLSDKDSVAVAQCLDLYDKRVAEMKDDLAKRRKTHFEDDLPDLLEFTEIYLPVDEVADAYAPETTAGYVDRLAVDLSGCVACLVDWKFGRWAVTDAQDNLQGIGYVLGCFRKFPKVQTIRCIFYQPLIEKLTEATFSRSDIPSLYLRVQAVVAKSKLAKEAAAKDDWSHARPMVPACNFCANIGKCHKVLEFACKVGAKFHPLEFQDVTPSKVLAADAAGKALRLASVLSAWAEGFRANTTTRVICRQASMPEGYSFAQGSGRRKIVSLEKFREVCLRYMKVKEYTASLYAEFGPVEDIIREKSPRGSKDSTIDQFRKELEEAGAVEKGQPYTYLRVNEKTK